MVKLWCCFLRVYSKYYHTCIWRLYRDFHLNFAIFLLFKTFLLSYFENKTWTHFKKERFALNFVTPQNAWKFAIFIEKENPCSIFCFSFWAIDMDQGIHKVKLFKMKNEKTTWIFFFYEYGIYGGQKFLKCVDFIINKKEIIRIVKINKQNYGKNTFPIKKNSKSNYWSHHLTKVHTKLIKNNLFLFSGHCTYYTNIQHTTSTQGPDHLLSLKIYNKHYRWINIIRYDLVLNFTNRH